MEIVETEPAASATAALACTLSLPAELGIESVDALKARLVVLLDTPAPLQLQAAAVERVHGAALQLFCLFCRERRGAGRSVEFVAPSPSLSNAAALFGASQLLQIPGTLA